MPVLRMLLLTVLVIALSACGGSGERTAADDASDAPTAHDMEDDGDDNGDMDAASDDHGGAGDADFAFGRPGDPAEAGRTIEVRTGNELVFDPSEVTVAAGEAVTFSVSNGGDLPHDFVIGDEAAQDEHAQEMSEMTGEMASEGAAHGDANAISVPPGETVELTWVFDGETAGLMYACHEPGHYDAGMIGDIIVEG